MDCSMPGLPVHCQLLEFTQTCVHWVGDAIQPSHPLSSPSPLPSIFPSIRVFSNESVLCIRWPKYWSFSFSISPSNEHPGLVSFRMDWLDLFAVQGTLKNLLQHHSSKASILQRSAFFIVLLSHPYMTTRKTIDLRRFLNQNQIMTIKSKYSECPVAKSCPALWDPMDCNPPASSVHGILQARILEWVAMLAYRSSSRPRDWTCISFVSCIGRRVPYYSATWEAQYSPANSKPDEPASEFNLNKSWDGSYIPLR